LTSLFIFDKLYFMKKFAFISIAFLLLWVSSCKKDDSKPKEEPPVITTPEDTTPVDSTPVEKIIEIKTSLGTMYMWLNKGTPLHRANFLGLADSNYFDSTTFHRIVPGFVIQGGDPNSKDGDTTNDGQGGPPWTIPAEINSSKFKHDYGCVGAARTNNLAKASSGSQFYIVVPQAGTHQLDGNYTVFGKVFKGMDVIAAIVSQPRDLNSNRPYTDIKMDVNVIEKTQKQLKDEFDFTVPQ
jgi:cyclophilin family peptidyl-prolyl cis-trans isomerase